MKKLFLAVFFILIAVTANADQAEWQAASNYVNSQCPIQVDSVTTIVNTRALENGLIYHSELAADRSDLSPEQWAAALKEIQRTAKNRALTDPDMGIFIVMKADMVYRYTDRNGVYIGTIQILKGGK